MKRNEGKPIATELLPIIFDPLVRCSSQVKGQGRKGSLGLGLYVVREFVQGHGGTIDVESSEQSGIAFMINLPRVAKV